MNKKDLKQLIKPLVKECIHEVLLEEGLLSNVVAEVAKGMQGNLVVENNRKKTEEPLFKEDSREKKRKSKEAKMKLEQHRKKLLDAVGKDAYNGVNVFEGTEPLRKSGNPDGSPERPSVLGDDPNDSGVDISSLVGNASKVWKAIK
tara:strand:- start:1605 stop:2042 length:438 start_codon:yes stop_codon:yes gene_type:complete